MIFITGPLYSGKKEYACSLLNCGAEELERRALWDVQDRAAGCDDLDALAEELAQYEVVIATEVGGWPKKRSGWSGCSAACPWC